MKEVRFVQECTVGAVEPQKHFFVGELADFDDDYADLLVSKGHAELAASPVFQPSPSATASAKSGDA